MRIDGRIVSDASDKGYLGIPRTPEGGVLLPGKGGVTPLFMGASFQLDARQPVQIDVAVGDEGGIFCAGLFLLARGEKIKIGEKGIPQLPLFILGDLNDDDKRLLLKYLPPVCVTPSAHFTINAE